MNKYFDIKYFDRYSGKEKTETVHASGFLNWCYNFKSGNFFTNLIFSRKLFTKIYGQLHSLRISRRKIQAFIEHHKIDIGEAELSIDEFKSFNDFFTRKLQTGKRKIQHDYQKCIAPADGKYLACENMKLTDIIKIKRHNFSLNELVNDNSMLIGFDKCSVLICRLHLSDYHRFHFPTSSAVSKTRAIKGRYHASAPYSLKQHMPGLAENYRVITELKSEEFGTILMIEVGAMTVGSIKQTFSENSNVSKGIEKGYFELGGSTIVLIFEYNRIKFDKDILENTKEGIETYIKMGDSVGNSKSIEGNDQ